MIDPRGRSTGRGVSLIPDRRRSAAVAIWPRSAASCRPWLSGFASLYADGPCRGGLLGHARRKYYDVYAADRSPTAADMRRIGLLYAIEREIPANRRGAICGPQDALSRILDELRTWLREDEHDAVDEVAARAGDPYTLTRWTALARYVRMAPSRSTTTPERRPRARALDVALPVRGLRRRRRDRPRGSTAWSGPALERASIRTSTCVTVCSSRIATHPINRIEPCCHGNVAPKPGNPAAARR